MATPSRGCRKTSNGVLQPLEPVILASTVPVEHVAVLGGTVLSAAGMLGLAIKTLYNASREDLKTQREENRATRQESHTAFIAVNNATEASREFVKTGGLLLSHLEAADAKMDRLYVVVEKLMENQQLYKQLGQDLIGTVLADMKEVKDDHTVIKAGIDALRRASSGP